MLNIILVQINPIVGDIENNTKKIISKINSFSKKNVDLIIFSECVITGYPPKDLLTYPSFINSIHTSIDLIKEESKQIKNTAIVIGTPFKIKNQLFNSAIVIKNGEIIFHQHKAKLPNYDVFDEKRYFDKGKNHGFFTIKNKKIGITICEDIWSQPGSEKDSDEQYSPVSTLLDQKIDLLINISASPFEIGKYKKRFKLLEQISKRASIPCIYVNQVGANDQLIFDGGSFALNNQGKLLKQLEFFKETHCSLDLTAKNAIALPEFDNVQLVEDALILGIKDYVRKTGFKKVVLGVSGGIDSAVTCALAYKALGEKNVHTVALPSPYSSKGSIIDAKQLAKNCNLRFDIIKIDKTYTCILNETQELFSSYNEDTTEENIQSRIRGNILMAISNKTNALLLTTGNKSELAMGYCTLYGDMCGALSVLADVPKTLVYKLARNINKNKELIPENSITKAPSAELRPGQLDSDSLPPYDQLDEIILNYIEFKKSVDEIILLGHDENLVKDIIKKINNNEFKRTQAATPLRVTSKSFGVGRRMPIASKYFI